MYECNDKMVSHPPHYQSETGLEVIDVIEAFTFDLKGIEATDTGNVIKYICRWKQKGGIQDLKKVMWYTQHLIDHQEKRKKNPIKWCHYQLFKDPNPNPIDITVVDVIEAFTFDLKGIEAAITGKIIDLICQWKERGMVKDLNEIMRCTQHLIDHLEKLEKENS